MFVRHGARRAPLTRPYDGPYRVKKRDSKFFVLQVGSREQVVSVDRLKPAFGFADPESGQQGPPAAARPPARGRPPEH